MSDKDQFPADNTDPDRGAAARPASGADERGHAGGAAGGSSASDTFDAIGPYLHPGRENVMTIYVLYLLGVVPAFGAVPAFIGFVLAFVNRNKADDTWNSHYDFQVRQGIMALIFGIVSAILVFVLIGFLGLAAVAIWWVVRSVIGLMSASRNERIRDPETYTW